MSSADAPVAVIGGGVLGAAVAYALARRGVGALLLESEDELALRASGTNSGILHTGFDSKPGKLETRLILRSGQLRPHVFRELGLPVIRCGAVLRPVGSGQRKIVAALARDARRNGVEVVAGDGGTLAVPGESVTDPVAYTLALARAATAGGGEVRTEARVEAVQRASGRLALSLAGGGRVTCDVAVNCAGLHADAVARTAGDDGFAIYPRKGEFLCSTPGRAPARTHPAFGADEAHEGGAGVADRRRQRDCGPTAHDQEDKSGWSVRPEAAAEVLPKARKLLPALEGAEPIASYAGLRPAGREGANYVIGASPACEGLINVAAIRSTGVTASLGIAEHVVALAGEHGVALGPDRALPPPAVGPSSQRPWWRRTAARVAQAA